MTNLKIGIANSVSANFNFDPFDTIKYAIQSEFPVIQIYLKETFLSDPKRCDRLISELSPFERVYFHAFGLLNMDFFHSQYYQLLIQFLENYPNPNFIIHFDETVELSQILKILNAIHRRRVVVFLENYFQCKEKDSAEKNLKKYLAVFTLSLSNTQHSLLPVLDIPRVFHKDLHFSETEALEWSFQLLNYFDNRRIPVTLHLIDALQKSQLRTDYCPLGEGYIPFDRIFQFIRKTHPPIEAIILEFEDKINPLKSREYLRKMLDELTYQGE